MSTFIIVSLILVGFLTATVIGYLFLYFMESAEQKRDEPLDFISPAVNAEKKEAHEV